MGRYDTSPSRSYTLPDGTTVRYLAPRILPFGWTVASDATGELRSDEVDRLDLFAYRTLGNPLLAWRICDANDAMDPFELCDKSERVLRLPGSGL